MPEGFVAARRNWWKLAFFVALIAFEVMRELYVLGVNEPPRVYAQSMSMFSRDGYAQAQGVWVRSDDSSPIVRNTVVIQCFRDWNTCFEVNTALGIAPLSLATRMDRQPILEMSDDTVVFGNTATECVTYRVRMDFSQERVIATRDKTPNAPALCDFLEDRVTTELTSGSDLLPRDISWTKEHFLPLYRMLMFFSN